MYCILYGFHSGPQKNELVHFCLCLRYFGFLSFWEEEHAFLCWCAWPSGSGSQLLPGFQIGRELTPSWCSDQIFAYFFLFWICFPFLLLSESAFDFCWFLIHPFLFSSSFYFSRERSLIGFLILWCFAERFLFSVFVSFFCVVWFLFVWIWFSFKECIIIQYFSWCWFSSSWICMLILIFS